MKQPLVSVIVPTRNSAGSLRACLQSITHQTYSHIELIVVDNFSTDSTQQIARQHTDLVFELGPERSAQRNYAATKSTGEYVVIIDSDMELNPRVIEACIRAAATKPTPSGIIIPEESFGEGFWAQCKRLERSFYVGVDWMEAARFFPTEIYRRLGGYDELLVAGEDWDLSRRAASLGQIVHIDERIRHNEGHLSLWRTLQKKYYYAQHARKYFSLHPERSTLTAQAGPLQRYKLFLSQPRKLFRRPLLGICMLFMKTAEFAAGALGYIRSGATSLKAD